MLPDDADVIVGKEYYLLSRGRLIIFIMAFQLDNF